MITIIIPTYERSKYLRRALIYWLRYPVNIIVIDGSESPSIELSEFEMHFNLAYFHMPVSLEERLLYAASILTGEYAIQISDDEFLSYDALMAASNILNQKKHISAVLGATLAFKKIDNKFLSCIWYSSAQNLNISGATPSERLRQRCLVRGNSIYYSLMRVETMRAALLMIGEHHYSCPYVAEYQMEATICLFGDVKVMRQVMWFRSQEVPMISNEGIKRNIFFGDWIMDSNNKSEIENLKRSINANFNRSGNSIDSITPEEFIKTFSNFERYEPRLLLIKNIIEFVKSFKLMKLLFLPLNKLRRRASSNFENLNNTKGKLKLHKIKFNDQEMNLISDIVMKRE